MDGGAKLEGGVSLQGCCRRCNLRLGALRRPDLYTFTESEKSSDCYNESLDTEPSTKKSKISVCICCLGLLQPEFWPAMLDIVKNEILQNGYDSDTFACGLSFPPSILIREHSINMHIKETNPDWQNGSHLGKLQTSTEDLVPLKQAWKWSFGQLMATATEKSLDSGAISQFLITVHTKYKDDNQELETLKSMVPQVFINRSKSFKKYRGEDYSRVSIDSTLSKIEPATFKQYFSCPPKEPDYPVECTSVECNHNPIYLGGRYIKYSRELSQTPWIVDGKRIMEGSIQEIIFQPIIDFYKITSNLIDNQLKFISSGREDVDVRCLGNGRPFAVEINNPTVTKLTAAQLCQMTNSMNIQPNFIKVTSLQLIQRSDLQILKMGEEVKTKTYEALCIKLENKTLSSESKNPSEDATIHSEELKNRLKPVLTIDDFNRINTYSDVVDETSIMITQKTPLRVLHRRPLLMRSRKIHQMHASPVDGKPNMFTLELTTQAGTYIKEFVHGDFGRTTPNLPQILGFKVDILALDVKSVNLDWPTKPST